MHASGFPLTHRGRHHGCVRSPAATSPPSERKGERCRLGMRALAGVPSAEESAESATLSFRRTSSDVLSSAIKRQAFLAVISALWLRFLH